MKKTWKRKTSTPCSSSQCYNSVPRRAIKCSTATRASNACTRTTPPATTQNLASKQSTGTLATEPHTWLTINFDIKSIYPLERTRYENFRFVMNSTWNKIHFSKQSYSAANGWSMSWSLLMKKSQEMNIRNIIIATQLELILYGWKYIFWEITFLCLFLFF